MGGLIDLEVSLGHINLVGWRGEASNRKMGVYVCKCIGEHLDRYAPTVNGDCLSAGERIRGGE